MEYLSVGLGGIGLFLLGMWLITEGLRLAAGASLEQLLARWTSGRFRGLLSGTLLTAVLQSSTVVTVTAIGFANAGLLTFQRAVWVIFGSNLGTTMTAWVVAVIGFKLKIDAFALPIIGIGALIRMFAPNERYRSLGMALAGFGILFLGIETLSGGFSHLSDTVTLDGDGYGVLVMVLLGMVLTTLMVSSSAATAVALTALATGLLTFREAAAVVIGTNVGTTATALIAALGATSNAKRLAFAHVLFNVLTGAVALVLLAPLLTLVLWLGDVSGLDDQPAALLALFHSLFNLIGVLLMWPIEPFMSRMLMARFHEPAKAGVSLQYLDRNVAAVPDAAPIAICREFEPLLLAYPAALAGLPEPASQREDAVRQREQHLDAIGEFFVSASRYPITAPTSDLLSLGWRIQHNLVYTDETLRQLNALAEKLKHAPDYVQVHEHLHTWFDEVSGHLQHIAEGSEGMFSFVELMPAYERVKHALLQAALGGQITRTSLDAALQMCSLSRRFAEQWLRAYGHWKAMQEAAAPTPPAAEEVTDAVPRENAESE